MASKLLKERNELKTLTTHFDESDRYVSPSRDKWTEKEELFHGTLNDELSDSAKSQVFDPRLATITLERAARVMGQLPTGKSLAVSADDKGKNMLMNLCLDKYVLHNANSQWDFLIKTRLMDLYSLVYGVMFGLVDWRVDIRRGYIGPDLWLLPIRDVFPQPGAVSVNECDWIQVSSLRGLDWLKSRDKSWENLDEIIKEIEEGGGTSRAELDSERRSEREEKFFTDVPAHQVELITEYRRYGGTNDLGEWVTFAPKYEKVVRRIDNPHANGELPIVAKHAFPLLDSIFGLGEFERGITLQKAINSLINLYLDGVKMSLFPPIMINKDQVVPSSIVWGPAAKWLVQRPDAIQQLQLSPQGLNTFQSTYQFLNAALLNQAGTTDTTVSKEADNTQGKTPQALKMIANRENSRDNWDRFQMEKTMEEIMKKFVNLVATKQETPITLRLFAKEINEIASVAPDVIEYIEGSDRGQVSVDAGTFENTSFDYQIVPGSMVMADKEKEVQNLNQLLGLIMSPAGQMILQQMKMKGKDIDFAELFTRITVSSGVQDWEKIIVDYNPQQDPMLQQQMQQQIGSLQDPEIQAAASQIMGNISEIPAQPGGMNGY